MPLAEQQRDGFGGHPRADHATGGAKDTGVGASRHGGGVRNDRIETTVATGPRKEDPDLAGGAEDAPMDQRTAAKDAGVGGEEAGREIIRPVDDEIVARDEVGGVLDREPFGVQGHLETRVDLPEGLGRRDRLGQTQGVEAMDDLAVQIGDLDLVRVGDADEPDARGSQIKPDRRTQPAGPEDEHLGFAEAELTGFPDPGQTNLPGVQSPLMVAQALVRGHADSRTPAASGVKPPLPRVGLNNPPRCPNLTPWLRSSSASIMAPDGSG